MDNLPRLQIVMDVDETMIAAEFVHNYENHSDHTDGTFRVCGQIFSYSFRPGLQHFLENVSRVADLHIFTTASKEYAESVCDMLDPDHCLFKNVWSFEHSHQQVIRVYGYGRMYTRAKSLSMVFGNSYDPRRTVLVDDNLDYHALNPQNGVLVRPFSPCRDADTEMVDLLAYVVDVLVPAEDVRVVLDAKYSLQSLLGPDERDCYHSSDVDMYTTKK
jgi:TFIIF-interacting CTD phosphatase-like protein